MKGDGQWHAELTWDSPAKMLGCFMIFGIIFCLAVIGCWSLIS